MNLWLAFLENLKIFEEDNKDKWFLYRGDILKFDCIVFSIEKKMKIKFKLYNFMESSESINYKYIPIEDFDSVDGISQEYVDNQIKSYAIAKLHSLNIGD